MENLIEFKSGLSQQSFDEIKGIFKGYASVFNEVDKVKDTIDPNAYDFAISQFKAGVPIRINFEHDKSIELAANLEDIYTDEKGLMVEWKFSEEAKAKYPDIFRWAVSKAKSGNLFKSIGFTVLKSQLGSKRYEMKKLGAADRIYSMILDHVAITDNPVDPKAKNLEVKGIRTPKYPVYLGDSWDVQTALKEWREFSKSTEAPSDMYKNGFLYVEDGREDLFGSYHFLVVNIVDGEPVINQQAVITAYRYLQGARQGVKILNSQQKALMLDVIAKLYTKINRVRKEEGVELLNEVEVKSEMNLNDIIDEIDGEVSAKRFLKSYKDSLSNVNVENFVNKVFSFQKTEEKSEKEFEASEQPLCENPVSVPETKSSDVLEDIAKLIKY